MATTADRLEAARLLVEQKEREERAHKTLVTRRWKNEDTIFRKVHKIALLEEADVYLVIQHKGERQKHIYHSQPLKKWPPTFEEMILHDHPAPELRTKENMPQVIPSQDTGHVYKVVGPGPARRERRLAAHSVGNALEALMTEKNLRDTQAFARGLAVAHAQGITAMGKAPGATKRSHQLVANEEDDDDNEEDDDNRERDAPQPTCAPAPWNRADLSPSLPPQPASAAQALTLALAEAQQSPLVPTSQDTDIQASVPRPLTVFKHGGDDMSLDDLEPAGNPMPPAWDGDYPEYILSHFEPAPEPIVRTPQSDGWNARKNGRKRRRV